MLFQSIFSAAVLFAASVIASPLPSEISGLDKRQSATTCGSTAYTAAKVSAAYKAGYSYYQQGSVAGSSTYPHKYNNYEGFDFPVTGPYEEFPILKSGAVYSGGSPGADRVIFSTAGKYAGAITHTGASGNDFVGCSGTS